MNIKSIENILYPQVPYHAEITPSTNGSLDKSDIHVYIESDRNDLYQ